MAHRPQNPAREPPGPGRGPQPTDACDATAMPAGAPYRSFWLGLALVGLVLLAYFPALSGGFIWDDDAHLTANPCVVGPLGLKEIWTSARMRICPLVQTSFWFEYRLWGLAPLPYHLVNILLHAAAAVVLWRLLRLWRLPGAWLGAALWALHPVQVESVAWITEMKNTQSGLFFLLTVLFFCRSRLADPAARAAGRARRDYILSLVFAALALASKSSTVVLPLVLGLCAWWMDRGWNWRRNLGQLAPVALLSALAAAATLWTQQGEGAFDPEFALGWAARLVVAGKVAWFYAGKLLWPHPLIFIYPRWSIDPADVLAWLPSLAAVALMVVLWWRRNRWARTAFFTAAYFLAALLPVLGLVDTFFWRYSFVGDHFQYLASMGPLALAGIGVQAGVDALGWSARRLAPLAGGVLLVAAGLLTWRQCPQYHNDETLWTATLAQNPASWIAHNNLGIEFDRQRGRSVEAIAQYEATLALRPRHAKAHSNLADDLARIPERQDDAIAHYEEALRLDPSLGLAHQNLGALLARRPGREAEALAEDEAAVRLLPDSAEAHYNLALELGRRPGGEDAAIGHYRTALRLRPGLAEAHGDLATLLARRPGGEAEAAAEFEAALRLRPDWSEAHNNFALLLERLPGRLPEAIAHYEKALRLGPDLPTLHNNLAGAYYRAGRLADAVRELESALRLDPNYETARRNLDLLRRQPVQH
ncbi:MAG TPA: tetratricopeptide repeat protein [Lacunisphaera sp.]|nr:tetratricopeptide repeat protein [Lacunisphaera sp.]